MRRSARASTRNCALSAEPWPEPVVLRVRMGLHAADGQLRADGQYINTPLNRCRPPDGGGARRPGRVLRHRGTARPRCVAARRCRSSTSASTDCATSHGRCACTNSCTLRCRRSSLGWFSRSQHKSSGRAHELRGSRTRDLPSSASVLTSSRLVTLTGVGGVGKTRLAQQVAAEVLPRFADGAWLVQLGPVADPDVIAETIASTLGIPNPAWRPGRNGDHRGSSPSHPAARTRQLRARARPRRPTRDRDQPTLPRRRRPRDEPGRSRACR